MPTHWTYADWGADSDLEQGDILQTDGELGKLLNDVYPGFCDGECLAFLVLTQSCDLVRRKGRPKSRYINLATVHPLQQALPSLLDRTCHRVADGVYLAESKYRATLLLDRIVNQNEQALGLFYLHPDADVGIAVSAVAHLQVSVAVQAKYYEILLSARSGRLTTEFQHKLGWLVGNLFSRVGTTDWPGKHREALVTEILRDGGAAPRWISRECTEVAAARGIHPEELPPEEVMPALEALRPPPPREQATDQVIDVIKEVVPSIAEQELITIKTRLLNNRDFNAAFRRAKRSAGADA